MTFSFIKKIIVIFILQSRQFLFPINIYPYPQQLTN